MSARLGPSAFVLLAMLATASSAEAIVPWDELPPDDRDIWQRLIGLEAGIAAMHCVQPLSAAAGEIEWRPKHFVAVAGCAVYSVNTVGLVLRQKWSLWVNLIGPLVGITAVTTGWVLNETGVIDAEVRPDVPQLVGGVLQTWAWIDSFRLMSRYRKRGESLLRHARIVPTHNGIALITRW